MNQVTNGKLSNLRQLLERLDSAAVAVSGGVDSMTLAFVAHRILGNQLTVLHAVSPAVPPEATERVRRYSASEGWDLKVLDAGEFEDESYRDNPSNRCYFCKFNLYDSIQQRVEGVILSGTNLDDLDDFRPGLEAAKEHSVRHPFVEAQIDKAGVREIAASFGLKDLATLPAAPCLSSRVETGIRIDPKVLEIIHAVENFVGERLKAKTIRCRFREAGVVVELDGDTLVEMSPQERSQLQASVTQIVRGRGFLNSVGIEEYVTGSAFLLA